ncbi:Kynurenine 3-monooxygenase [Wickerhamiella sorbophila]|uniref:Kynurenine 3-monooxygenase n=1 Tax=Wickerhamiella sorbophila TaxID=45607 RepID=A0A2T0FIA8_9ASCO|nr:Kynurenine 3-monooxygenase [Wickerhamiella sorbophila]PRT54679.1 Kynurenine 3-monooxygenase [Wickerhamiella sorbophila]
MSAPRSNKTKVVIVGAGPVGCVCALAMKKRGHNVVIYEARSDPRLNRNGKDTLRSINLAISARGIRTLKTLDYGLFERIASNFVPMQGRMIHSLKGEQTSVKYGLNGESINSISRLELNRLLLEEVDRAGVEIKFEYKLKSATFTSQPESVYETSRPDRASREVKVRSDVIIGCDGSHSKLRYEMQKACDMNYSQVFIDHHYIEMVVPSANDGGYVFNPNHLHIWPRKDFMFICLANSDGSFTGTLFAPRQLLDSLSTFELFLEFFRTNFNDALLSMGEELLSQYYKNPRGKLMSVKCTPYHYRNIAIILGDAAHSTVPFYGQGLNCGLEDVRVLMELMDKYPSQKAFSEYSIIRHDDLVAINDLSMRNYIEMRHSVSTLGFAFRKKLDAILCKVLGDRWLPLYTMVSFRPDIRYSEAVRRDAQQARILRILQNAIVFGAANVVLAAGVLGHRHLLSTSGYIHGYCSNGTQYVSNSLAWVWNESSRKISDQIELFQEVLPSLTSFPSAAGSIISNTGRMIRQVLEYQLTQLNRIRQTVEERARAISN